MVPRILVWRTILASVLVVLNAWSACGGRAPRQLLGWEAMFDQLVAFKEHNGEIHTEPEKRTGHGVGFEMPDEGSLSIAPFAGESRSSALQPPNLSLQSSSFTFTSVLHKCIFFASVPSSITSSVVCLAS